MQKCPVELRHSCPNTPIYAIQDKIRKELLKLDVPIAVKNLLDRLTNTKADRLKYIPYLWNLVFNNLECMDFTKKITMASIINPKGLK